MAQENHTPDFEALAEELIKEIPKDVAELAKGFFKGSFIKQGFTDSAFMPWPQRKSEEANKILTKSQTLRDSIKVQQATEDEVIIEAGRGIPYAEIHNTGGTINIKVTPKSKKFFWYMFKKTGNEKWKWMAMTKKKTLNIYIPQRQFIGDSQTLMKNIDNYFGKRIIAKFQNIK